MTISTFLLVAGISLSPLVLSAQTNLSSHPAGFIKITVPARGYVLASVPYYMFENGTDELRNNLTASDDPEKADCLLLWDTASAEYITLMNSGKSWINKESGKELGDFTLLPTEGFVIQNRQDTDKEICLAGEVVLDEEITTRIQPSLNLIGYPYSAVPEETALGGVVSNKTIKLGKGYWVNNQQTNALEVTEKRPYADVFPDALPCVKALQVSDKSAELTILTAGTLLDIYCQDLSTNEFDSVTGWQVLAQDIAVKAAEMQWKDNTVSGVNGRYYLVCRSDIDLDSNGIADCREIFLTGTKKPSIGSSSGGLADFAILSGTEGVADTSGSSTNGNITVKADKKLIFSKVLYVNKHIGRDALTGLKPVVQGKDGPKFTIKAALAAAHEKDEIQIDTGNYDEDVNISGLDISVNITGMVNLTRGSTNVVSQQEVLPSNPTNTPVISK